MPQGDHIELFQKRYGFRLDKHEREYENHFGGENSPLDVPELKEKKRKREARRVHERSRFAQQVKGIKAKLYHQQRHKEKVEMKKSINMHKERDNKHSEGDVVKEGAVPAYLMDRQNVSRAKVLSNMLKQKRQEKAGKWDVPLPRVKAISEDEMFKVIKTGAKQKKAWKRMITKATYVPDTFVRAPPKYERMIRPMGLRYKKANVTHPELKTTLCLDILGVKKNPQSPMYTSLGVITKGTIIEVNVADMGLVTQTGRVVWGKYAQVMNNPENDGCINAVLLV